MAWKNKEINEYLCAHILFYEIRNNLISIFKVLAKAIIFVNVEPNLRNFHDKMAIKLKANSFIVSTVNTSKFIS